jgi:protein FrlC
MNMLSWDQVAAMNQHYQKYSFHYFLEQQKKLGIKNLELWLGTPHFYLDRMGSDNCEKIRDQAEKFGMKIVSVTTPSFAWQFQYASKNESIRRKGIQYFKNGIRVAAKLGAGIMTVNSGWGYPGETEKEGFERSVETLRELAETAKEQNIILTLESLTSKESKIGDTLEKIERIWKAVDSENLEIMVDTVALGYQKEELEEWFKTFGKHLIHMHFIDIDKDKQTDDHLVWGDGSFSLSEMSDILKKYQYKGYVVQEIAAERYQMNPEKADERGVRELRKYFK